MVSLASTALLSASRQWAERPDDERFWTLSELHAAAREMRAISAEVETSTRSLSRAIEARGDELGLVLPERGFSRFSTYSFEKFAGDLGAPPDYLRKLPIELAAECLREGFDGKDRKRVALVSANGFGSIVRGVTSDRYNRLWNEDVAERLLALEDAGWKVTPARPHPNAKRTRLATEDDVIAGMAGGVQVRVGDTISPAGLYLGDRDLFAFLIDPNRRVNDGSEGGLFRGVICRASEVGGISLLLETFFCRGVCGNHIVWDVSGHQRQRIIHVGETFEQWKEAVGEVRSMIDGPVHEEEAAIEKARGVVLGKDADEIAEWAYGRRVIPKRRAREAFEIGEKHVAEDGDPRTAWGFANAITRLSQNVPFQDERLALDRASGRALSVALAA